MKTYRDIYYKYITVSMVGAVILGILMGVTKINRMYLVAGIALWLILNTAFWFLMAKNREKRLMNLYRDCNISEYIDEYEAIDQRFPKFGDDFDHNSVRLNLAAGLHAHGEFSEMKRVLDMVRPSKGTDLRDLVQRVCYHNDLALYYIERGELGAAEAELTECYPLFELSAFKEPKRSEYLDATERIYETIQLKRGNYEGLDKRFANWIRDVEDPLQKVACSYRLGELYYNHDMIDEAKKQFEFVVKYGGDTFFAERAADVLKLKGSHKAKL